MDSEVVFKQEFEINGGDFVNAGESASKLKNILKEIGIDTDIIRRLAIAAYEAEVNVVTYARHGIMRILIYPEKILLTVEDEGQGIKDIDLAMQPGYSTATDEIREMGFGAGLGLPNMKKNADIFNISSTVDKGTKLEITMNLNDKNVRD
ncbi:anti-sigma regulatory factor [candidate division WOR-3 bacterium]|nr:anti-sigma regulatory factor [candidate division WOR-3 bacterium]MCK4526368.1 anti-sigma regulatory factor [candidate division WOR-3 bacterium]